MEPAFQRRIVNRSRGVPISAPTVRSKGVAASRNRMTVYCCGRLRGAACLPLTSFGTVGIPSSAWPLLTSFTSTASVKRSGVSSVTPKMYSFISCRMSSRSASVRIRLCWPQSKHRYHRSSCNLFLSRSECRISWPGRQPGEAPLQVHGIGGHCCASSLLGKNRAPALFDPPSILNQFQRLVHIQEQYEVQATRGDEVVASNFADKS